MKFLIFLFAMSLATVSFGYETTSSNHIQIPANVSHPDVDCSGGAGLAGAMHYTYNAGTAVSGTCVGKIKRANVTIYTQRLDIDSFQLGGINVSYGGSDTETEAANNRFTFQVTEANRAAAVAANVTSEFKCSGNFPLSGNVRFMNGALSGSGSVKALDMEIPQNKAACASDIRVKEYISYVSL